ncbi:hypothetical protein TB2_039770 [Malus domestica]
MVTWFCRKTDLINRTSWVLEIRVRRIGAPEGESYVALCLKPHQHKDIPATKFLDDSMDGHRARVIRVKRQNGPEFLNFSPEEFISNIKLTFEINAEGVFDVTKLRNDQRITTELTRILPTRLREFVRSRTLRHQSDERTEVDDCQEEILPFKRKISEIGDEKLQPQSGGKEKMMHNTKDWKEREKAQRGRGRGDEEERGLEEALEERGEQLPSTQAKARDMQLRLL